MNRSELLRLFILDDIADDYEEIEHITGNVTALAQKCGLTVSSGEVREELMNLIDAGFAKAYRFTGRHLPEDIRGRPLPEELEETATGYVYFWITESGRELHGSRDDWWPFDDDDSLRIDWSLTD